MATEASGLRWLSFMLRAPISWADRVWALPFLTGLAPSERFSRERRRRHKAPHGLGPADAASDRSLAAGTTHHRRRGQQLRRHRVVERRARTRLRDHLST